jgi:hypothetical protein
MDLMFPSVSLYRILMQNMERLVQDWSRTLSRRELLQVFFAFEVIDGNV